MKTKVVVSIVIVVFLGLVAYSEAVDWAAVKAKKDELKKLFEDNYVLAVQALQKENSEPAKKLLARLDEEKGPILLGLQGLGDAIDKQTLTKQQVEDAYKKFLAKVKSASEDHQDDVSKLSEGCRKAVVEHLTKILEASSAIKDAVIKLLDK